MAWESYRDNARSWHHLTRGGRNLDEHQQERRAQLIATEETIIAALRAAGLSKATALSIVGISSTTWHYRHHPRPQVANPTPRHLRTGTKIPEEDYEEITRLVS